MEMGCMLSIELYGLVLNGRFAVGKRRELIFLRTEWVWAGDQR
jgi:hypothetical protein